MESQEFKKIVDLRSQALPAIAEGKQAGIPIFGYYCAYTPLEFAYAADAIIVPLCARKDETLDAADRDLPQNLCPIVRTIYDLAMTNSCPYFIFCDLVIAETTCDGKKKVYELLQQVKNVHIMNLPQIQKSEASLALWESEMRRLKTVIEEQIGRKLTDTRLRKAIRLTNRENILKKELFDLNRADPPLISGKDLIVAASSLEFAPDRKIALETLENYIQELKKMARTGYHVGKKNSPRILYTGCPVGSDDDKVIKLVEESGGQVVALEYCGGYKYIDLLIDENDTRDPVTLLTEKYLQVPCSVMCPNDGRLKLLERMITDFNIGGVIDLTWQACHTYNIESYRVGKLVTEKLGKSYLHLETNFSDADIENLRVRIEAFLEMVRAG
jgi:benzoyl-CoA reductase/2-hydroxyglutaryl-CoA dehydratase subunit BcrC/BadD/HgdB